MNKPCLSYESPLSEALDVTLEGNCLVSGGEKKGDQEISNIEPVENEELF